MPESRDRPASDTDTDSYLVHQAEDDSVQGRRERAFSARFEELEMVAKMLVRHHGFDRARAWSLVWSARGGGGLSGRGRPPKPHLLRAANVADEVLASGRFVRWNAVHQAFVALNEPQEQRAFECGGERSVEPRDAENWQRAVRRIRRRLRALAATLARCVS
jgi:dienelactone hydrolase